MVFDVLDSDGKTVALGNVHLLIEVNERVEAGIFGPLNVGDDFA